MKKNIQFVLIIKKSLRESALSIKSTFGSNLLNKLKKLVNKISMENQRPNHTLN